MTASTLVECPHCRTRLKVPESRRGTVFRCAAAACGKPIDFRAKAPAEGPPPIPSRTGSTTRRPRMWWAVGAGVVGAVALASAVALTVSPAPRTDGGGTGTFADRGEVKARSATSPPAPKPDLRDEDAARILVLMSRIYTLDGKDVPLNRDPAAFLPFLSSPDRDIRDAAALASRWQLTILQAHEADRQRHIGLSNMFGLPFAGGADRNKPTQIPPGLVDAVDAAAKAGALAAFEGADFWAAAVEVFAARRAENYLALSRAQSDFFRLSYYNRRMLHVVYDRGAVLAKRITAGSGRESDLEVTCNFESGRGNWGTLQVKNRSEQAIEALTLSTDVTLAPLPSGNAGADFLLGAVVGAAMTDGTAGSGVTTGNDLVTAAAADRAKKNLPTRYLLHVPRLGPGSSIDVSEVVDIMQFGRVTSGRYSVRANGVIIEDEPIPGLDAALEKFRKERANRPPPSKPGDKGWKAPPRPEPARRADAFVAGSVWVNADKKMTLRVTSRTGTTFRGRFLIGDKVERDIKGTFRDGQVSWAAADVRAVRGTVGNDNTGTLAADGSRLDMTWTGKDGRSHPYQLRAAGNK